MKNLLISLFFVLSWASFQVNADVSLQYNPDGTVTLSWQNPTEYTNGDTLAPENYVKTVIERSATGPDTGYDVIGETMGAGIETYRDPMLGLAQGDWYYRVYAVAVDPNLQTVEIRSEPSNVTTASLFILRGIAAPVLTIQ